MKKRLSYCFRLLLVFLLVFSWLLTSWPPIWKKPRFPPEVNRAQAAFQERTETNVHGSSLSSPYQASASVPTGTVDGDLMFTSIETYSGTVTTNPAWTLIGSYTAQSDKYYLFARVASSEPGSYTWTFSGSTRYKIVVTTYIASSDFNVTNVSTDLWVSNTSYRTNDNINRAASFNVPYANSPIVFFGGVYSTSSKTQEPPTNPGSFEEDYDAGHTTPDLWLEIASYIWSGSGLTGNIDSTISTSLTTKHAFAVALKPPSITTLGNGVSEPSNTTIGPGGSITDLDNFTLQTSVGTDTVTAATVTLGPDGAYNNIAQVDITDTSDTAKCTAVTNPASNTVSFSTCNISVGIGATAYKVRITPKSHANMPPVPGAGYDTTGTVTDITCNNSKSLNDSGSATITVDNASPGEVSNTSGTPGNQQVQLNWTNPGDSDYAGVVILRRASTAVGDNPTEGSSYSVGNTIGSSTVACVENYSATTCTDSGLNNGTPYHYKIFTKDSRGNYSAGTVPTDSPFTPQTPIAISITTDGTVGFGYLGIGASADNSGDLQIVQVDSGPANLEARSTGFTAPGNTWNLGVSNSTDQVKWEFSKDASSWTTFAIADTLYPFASSVGTGVTTPLYLRLTMPTSTNSYDEHSAMVTVVASSP